MNLLLNISKTDINTLKKQSFNNSENSECYLIQDSLFFWKSKTSFHMDFYYDSVRPEEANLIRDVVPFQHIQNRNAFSMEDLMNGGLIYNSSYIPPVKNRLYILSNHNKNKNLFIKSQFCQKFRFKNSINNQPIDVKNIYGLTKDDNNYGKK